jgi:streptogramin lyase
MKQKRNFIIAILALSIMTSCVKQGMTPAKEAASLTTGTITNNLTVTPNIVYTLAGDTVGGLVDGVGSAARFLGVVGIALDSSGDLFVAEAGNRVIRKVTQTGVVTTFAGNPILSDFAASDGPLHQAEFAVPRALCFDGAGNIFVTDDGTQQIRIISGGFVETYAGPSGDIRDLNILGGFADGPAGFAKFAGPEGVAADAAGNVYVADFGNKRIRKISTSGQVSTLAGKTAGFVDGPDTAARFGGPAGMAIDKGGNLYVADQFANAIRKVTPNGVVTTVAGNGQLGLVNGVGGAARFNNPTCVAVDNEGNLYVGDHGNFCVRKISPNGTVSTFAGNGTEGNADGLAANAQFFSILGITVDASGVVYVCDGSRIRVILRPRAH